MPQSLDLKNISFVDLTHTLVPTIPHWSGRCGFQHTITSDYNDCSTETKFRAQSIQMFAGIGTHMDAPVHCFPGAADIANIPLEQLITPCVVVDVSHKAHENYCVIPDDIRLLESQYGTIKKNSFVIIHTGWDKFWENPEKYRNNLIFPTISEDVAELLLERGIVGLGVDTLSPDNGANDFPVHRLILGSGRYIIENIANAQYIPPVGAYSISLPLKIQEGAESPIRLIAMTGLERN